MAIRDITIVKEGWKCHKCGKAVFSKNPYEEHRCGTSPCLREQILIAKVPKEKLENVLKLLG